MNLDLALDFLRGLSDPDDALKWFTAWAQKRAHPAAGLPVYQ